MDFTKLPATIREDANATHITQLPITVLEEIIILSNLRVWCLVSRQFFNLSYTPWVKTEWLAQQPLLPRQPVQWRPLRRLPAQRRLLRRLVPQSEMSPMNNFFTRPTDEFAWANAFGGRWHIDFEPQFRAYLKVPAPHNPNFFDLAVLRMLHSRHPRKFLELRDGVLMHVAFWYKEEETIFMIEQGAPVDYANGWVLARFACRPDAYHRGMIGDLIHNYGANVYHYSLCGNVLFAVLVQHSDCGDLVKYLISCDKAKLLLEKGDESLVFRAIKCGNLKATRYLLDLYRENGEFNTIDTNMLWMSAHECGGDSTGMMKMLVEEYGVQKERSIKLMYAYVNANKSHANDRKNLELWDWLWGDNFTINEDYLYASMDMLSLYHHLRQRASYAVSWQRVMLLAVEEINTTKARILLDSGLCSVHFDADDTLRQRWAIDECLNEAGFEKIRKLDSFVQCLTDRGTSIHAAIDAEYSPVLSHANRMRAEYLSEVSSHIIRPRANLWKVILTDALSGSWRIALLPLPYFQNRYLNTIIAGRPPGSVSHYRMYHAERKADRYNESLFVVIEDVLSGKTDCHVCVSGQVLSKGRLSGVDIVWEHTKYLYYA